MGVLDPCLMSDGPGSDRAGRGWKHTAARTAPGKRPFLLTLVLGFSFSGHFSGALPRCARREWQSGRVEIDRKGGRGEGIAVSLSALPAMRRGRSQEDDEDPARPEAKRRLEMVTRSWAADKPDGKAVSAPRVGSTPGRR